MEIEHDEVGNEQSEGTVEEENETEGGMAEDNIMEDVRARSPQKPLPSRKRKINPSKKERNKIRRSEGRHYTNKIGHLTAGHTIGELSNCLFNEKLLLVKNDVFDSFWDLVDFDKQNPSRFGLIRITL